MPVCCLALIFRWLPSVFLAGLVGCQSSSVVEPVLASLPRSQLSSEATTRLADGNQAARIDAYVCSDDGRPLVDVPVFLYCEDAAVSFAQPPATDANGHTTGYARSVTGGAKWVQAVVNSAQGIRTLGRGVHVTFADADEKHPLPPSLPPASLALRVVADEAVADGMNASVVAAEGHHMRGQRVVFASDDGNDTLRPPSGVVDANGTLHAGVSSTRAGTRRITARTDTLCAQANVTLIAGQAAATHCQLVINPNAQMADGVAGVDITGYAADAYDNRVAGAALWFASSDPCHAFFSGSSATDTFGLFGITVRSTHAGPATLSASIASGSGSVTLSGNATFLAGAPDATMSHLTASPNRIALGANVLLTARVADAYGNPVDNQLVSWSASGPGHALVPPSGPSAANGTATSVLTPGIAGRRRLAADANGAALSGTLDVTLDDARYAQSSVAVSAATLIADGIDAATLHLVLQDANGVPVVGENIVLSGGNGIVFDPNRGATDSQGVVDANVTSSVPQAATLLASWANVTFGVDVAFTPMP